MSIVRRFVETALIHHFRMTPAGNVLPDEMRDPTIPPIDDWVGWKPVPSTVTDADLDDLERKYGFRYPPLCREFLQTLHYASLPCYEFEFYGHEIGRWRADLEQLYRDWAGDKIMGRGLIPFGAEMKWTAGPVCFDTRYRYPDVDCPIVLWDHGWIGTECEIQLLFSSCERMFHCLTFAAEASVPFTYLDPKDDAALAATKRTLMAEFLAIDPEGAGGPGRRYWTAGGLELNA